MAGYVGANLKAQELVGGWVGVKGKARRLVGGWVGVNGKARPIWSTSGWRREDNIPYNFYQGSAVVFQGKVHLLGGVDNPTKHVSWDGTNWAEESTLPYNLTLGSAIVWNNKIHILGSSSAYSAHYSWDGSAWTQEANTPHTFYGENNAVIYDGYIHVVSSWWGNYSQHRYIAKYDGSAWTTVFNPANNSYSSSASYDGKIYLLGASGTGGAGYQEYEDGAFGNVESIPYQFNGGFALVYNGKIHMLGSVNANNKIHEVFDGTDFDLKSTMPYEFYYCPAVVYRGRIHIFGGNANRTEHWSYGEGINAIFSNLYPDANVTEAGTISKNNGSRTPVTKPNDGDGVCFISKNGLGTGWGGNWIVTCCIALSRDAALLTAPNTGNNVTSHVINGVTYWIGLQGTNGSWGGGTQVENPLGLPIYDDLYICPVNASPTTARVTELIELLGIQVKS